MNFRFVLSLATVALSGRASRPLCTTAGRRMASGRGAAPRDQ